MILGSTRLTRAQGHELLVYLGRGWRRRDDEPLLGIRTGRRPWFVVRFVVRNKRFVVKLYGRYCNMPFFGSFRHEERNSRNVCINNSTK